MLRFLLTLAMKAVLFTGLVMGPALAITGELDWPRGWLAIFIMLAAGAVGGLNADPELARERASIPSPQTLADGAAMLLVAFLIVAWFVCAAWDVHRLHLLPVPQAVSLWVGLGVSLLGSSVIVWTFRVNSFATQEVKINSERHQRVIDTGPYAVVRHPLYAGTILFFAGLGLILGSLAAALMSIPVFVAGFLPRIAIEEATLRRDLAGYSAYQARVRSRILPGVL